MAKNQVLDDAFEQALELGQSTAKHTVKSVAQTFSPVKLWEHATGKDPSRTEAEKASAEKMLGKKASTPLDFQRLQEAYNQQDKQKADALKNRLFQLVKGGGEKAVADIKRAEEQKKRAEEQEEADKKRRHQASQQQSGGEAQGKLKKGQKKKPAEPAPAEVKVSQGK